MPLELLKTGVLLIGSRISCQLGINLLFIEVQVVANASDIINVESALQILVHVFDLGIVDTQLLLVCLKLNNVLVIVVDTGLLPVLLVMAVVAASPLAASTTSATAIEAVAASTSIEAVASAASWAAATTSAATPRTLSVEVSTATVVARSLLVDLVSALLSSCRGLRCIVASSVCSLECLTKWLIDGTWSFISAASAATATSTTSTAATLESTATWPEIVFALAVLLVASASCASTSASFLDVFVLTFWLRRCASSCC